MLMIKAGKFYDIKWTPESPIISARAVDHGGELYLLNVNNYQFVKLSDIEPDAIICENVKAAMFQRGRVK